MKLSKIKLLNYGTFPIRELDFEGSPFVTIFGKNESGKSTMLQGIRESLFGFTKSTFSSSSGEIAAEVHATLGNGSSLSFRRKKGKKTTFNGIAGSTKMELKEEAWLKMLGPIDLATYANLFGFSLRELAQGQESLRHVNLTNALLGSSRSGHLDWRMIREVLEKERDQLFTPMGRTQHISNLLKRLKETKEKIDRTSVLPKDYRQLRDADDEIAGLLDRCREEQVRLRGSLRQLDIDIESHNLGIEYLQLNSLLLHQKCPDGVTAEWAKTWIADSAILEKLELELANIDAELRRLSEQIHPLDTESRLLELAPTFRQLVARANSLSNDEQQLGRLQADHRYLVAAIDERIANLSTKWNSSHWEQLVIDIERRQELKQIVVATRDLQLKQKELHRERERILRDIQRLDSEWNGEATPQQAAAFSLSILRVQSVRDEFLKRWPAALESLEKEVECQELTNLLRERLIGDALEGLARSELPDATAIERHRKACDKLQLEIGALSEDLREAKERWIDLEHEASSLQAEHALPDMANLKSLRSERDTLLSQLKASSTRNSDKQHLLFAESDEEDASGKSGTAAQKSRAWRRLAELNDQLDNILDRVLQNAQAMVLHEKNRLQRAECQQRIDRLQGLRTELLAELSRLEELWRGSWEKVGIHAGGVDAMERWLEEFYRWYRLSMQIRLVQESTLEGSRNGLVECKDTVAMLGSAWTQKWIDLDAKLQSPWTPSLGREYDEFLVELISELRIKQERAERQSQSEAKKMQWLEDLKSTELQIASVDLEMEHYQQLLQQWCADHRLPAIQSAELAEQLMDELVELRSKKIEEARLRGDVSYCEANLVRLEEEMRHALGLVGQESPDWSRIQLSQSIQLWNSRIDDAERQIQSRDRLIVQRDERSSLRNEKRLVWEQHDVKRQELLKRIPEIDTSEARLLAEKAIEYWKDRERLDGLRWRLESKLGSDSLESWLERIGSRKIEELESERDELSRKLSECETIVQEKTKEHGVLQQRILDIQLQDPLSEWEEERQDLLAQLEDQSERWIVLSIAGRLIDEATSEFQEKQERGLLDRAIRIFQLLTDGEYLEICHSQEDPQQFVVVDRHGTEKTPLQLSTGTREQLYLSFRLAFVEQYCETNEPLPLVLDDCFVNFDEQRLGNTLQTISSLASVEQVILLSCHERTSECVRRKVPAALHLEL